MIKVIDKNENYKKKRTNQKQKYWMNYNSYKKCKNVYRNKAIAKGLHQYAKAQGFKGFFITSLPEKSNAPSSTRRELSTKFQKIRQTLDRHSIISFGYKSFEKHKSGLYHLHVMIYVSENDSEEFQEIYKKYFNNYVNLNENSIKEIDENFQYIDDYLIWFSTEDDENEEITKVSEKSDVSFFGIKKGTISRWDYIYKNKRKNLTEDEFKIKKHIANKNYNNALELLNAFIHDEQCENDENISIKKIEKTTKKSMNIYIVETLSIIEQIMYSIQFFYFHGPPVLKIIINFFGKRQHIINNRRHHMNRLHSKQETNKKIRNITIRVRGPPLNKC